MSAIQAAGKGWDVTVITDACGALSAEENEVAIQRMAAAGVNLMTWQPSGSVIGRGPTLQLGPLTYLFSMLPVAASRICGSSNCSIAPA
jgi:hypothetical protein